MPSKLFAKGGYSVLRDTEAARIVQSRGSLDTDTNIEPRKELANSYCERHGLKCLQSLNTCWRVHLYVLICMYHGLDNWHLNEYSNSHSSNQGCMRTVIL